MKAFSLFAAAFLSCAVQAATPAVVMASQFGFDAKDATECLRKAIHSGAKTVIIDNTGKEWLTGPQFLRSDLELVLAKGVIVRAKPGLFHGRGDCLFRMQDLQNVTIRGEEGAVIRMNKADYQDPARYAGSEWRHALCISGSRNVVVKDFTIDGSGGDGITLDRGRKHILNVNVKIQNMTVINHHRLCMGVATVKGLLIENCRFLNNSGTAPNGGFDVEMNHNDEPFSDMVIRNCVFRNNAALGLMFILGNLDRKSAPVSAVIENCDISGNRQGALRINGTTAKGTILFRNCRFSAEEGTGFSLCNFSEGGLKVVFRDCLLDARKSSTSPIVLSSNAKEDFGGVDLGNLVILAPPGREPVYVSGLGSAGLTKSFTGKPVIRRDGKDTPVDLAKYIAANKADPQQKNFSTCSFRAKEYKAPMQQKKAAREQVIRFRGRNMFTQWLRPGDAPVLTFRLTEASSNVLKGEVEVLDNHGGFMDRFTIDGKVKIYKLPKAALPSSVTFRVNAGPHTVLITSTHAAHGIAAENPARIYTGNHEFWFLVDPAQTDVVVRVLAEEPVCAALRDSTGKTVVQFNKRFTGPKVLRAARKPGAKTELWSLKLSQVVEDYGVQVGAPSAPIFFSAPENAVERR